MYVCNVCLVNKLNSWPMKIAKICSATVFNKFNAGNH